MASNLLNREFTAEALFEKLVTDITYLPFGQSMMYLSSILEVFNVEIVTRTIRFTQDTEFVLDTLGGYNQTEKITMTYQIVNPQGTGSENKGGGSQQKPYLNIS
ncbi:hypothetical protein ACFOYZ_19775, partial [Neobacillus cucumis]